MNDEIAIQQVLNTYTEAVSRKDWRIVMSVFLPKATWEIAGTDLRFVGPDGIRQGLEALLAPMDFLVQINAPAVIRIERDHAFARATIREAGTFRDEARAIDAFGSYEDKLVRSADGWRFASRIFTMLGSYSTTTLPSFGG